MASEDDEVVEEMDVYLSQGLQHLYVFQYPVVPAAVHQNIGPVIKSEVKLENQVVRLEVELDTGSVNYDPTHGQQIAASLNKEPSNQPVYSGKTMDKMEVGSCRCVKQTDTERYCVGQVVGGELRLLPLEGLLSLRPLLSHLEPPRPPTNPKTEELEQVRVQFARNESDRVKQLREQSYATYARRIAQEPWYQTRYSDLSSKLAQEVRSRMREGGVRGSGGVELTRAGYLSRAAPQDTRPRSSAPPALPHSLVSLSTLRSLPPSQRISILLTQVMTASLSQLVWMSGESEERTLQCVQECGVLVQGNWVLRSDLLYPRGSHSSHNGVPAEAMQRARDYILYELNSSGSVERKRLSNLVRIPHEELKDVMCQVGVLRQNRTWVPRLPPDTSFLERFPHVVEREQRLWTARHQRLSEDVPPPAPQTPPRPKTTRSSGGPRAKKTQPPAANPPQESDPPPSS